MTTKTKARPHARPSGKRTRTVRRTVYTARHLKRYYPDGFRRALEQHAESVGEDNWRADELMDSLKGLFEAAGVRLKDWEIGAYSYSSLKAQFPSHEGDDGEAVGELRGARAMAWLENNLFGPLRAPWGFPKDARHGLPAPRGYSRPFLYRNGKTLERKSGALSRYTRPGHVPDCPFTGVCYDDDLIDAVTKAVREGDTLREAFEGLADVCRKTLEAEYEYDASEEAFLESADANGWEYTKEGRMVGRGD